MLILTRRLSQKIMVGDHIVIEVIKTFENSVQLEIDIPEGVSIGYDDFNHQLGGSIFRLTRQVGEQCKIGQHTVIEIFDIRKGEIRIGIKAPKEIIILRDEIYDGVKNKQVENLKEIY